MNTYGTGYTGYHMNTYGTGYLKNTYFMRSAFQ